MDLETKNEILSAIQIVDRKVDTIQKEVAKIPEMQKQTTKIPKMQEELSKISVMQQQILELQKDMQEVKGETRKISQSIAVIEHEHGDQIKVLFDAFTIHAEKIEQQNKRIEHEEYRLEKHDTEIDYLKTKVQGL